MCGRFNLRTPSADWCQLFLPDLDPDQLPFDDPPRYNIAPTQPVVCILREATGDPKTAIHARWGLIPYWAKDPKIGNRMINARGETVDSKSAFREPFASRRCLVPADGYYEWKKMDDGRQPYLISRADGGLLAMAGLWDNNRWVTDDGSTLRSCTIITTNANERTRGLHDRMPVMLDPSDHEQWLDPGYRDTERLKQLIKPAPNDLLQMTAVSRRVNSPHHDDEQCMEPIADGQTGD